MDVMSILNDAIKALGQDHAASKGLQTLADNMPVASPLFSIQNNTVIVLVGAETRVVTDLLSSFSRQEAQGSVPAGG
jgi:hypothetical protein